MKSLLRNYGTILVAAAIAAILLVAALAFAAGPRLSDSKEEEVPVRAALADYSWGELARIASQISACQNQDDAVACAQRYNLCDATGKLSWSQQKPVKLAGGVDSSVVLAGIWHDERADGGKAGLTFLFSQPVGMHSMNHSFENPDGDDADSVGGWAASDMRAWLNDEFIHELPLDLQSRITPVQKTSANAASSRDELDEAGRMAGAAADMTSQTTDKLWLPSAEELCGAIPTHRALGIDSTMAAVYASEGGQYRLFADSGVAAFKPNDCLAMTPQASTGAPQADSDETSRESCTWWLRTKTLEFGDGFWLVGTDGTPLNGLGEDVRATSASFAPDKLWGPDHARAVLPCFCL